MRKRIASTFGELFAPQPRMQRDGKPSLDLRFVATHAVGNQTELAASTAAGDAKALAVAREAAEAGHPQAQTAYGHMLLLGHGTANAPDEACRWFQRAADAGHVDAINMVGRCFENGWGVTASSTQALRWYRKAAEAGHVWACFNLGMLLFDGDGCERDRSEALVWFLRAGRMRNAKAMNMLGICCEEAVRPRFVQAFNWYRRAAAGGDFRGQFNFGRMLYMAGHRESGLAWLSRSLETGIPEFCQNAAQELLASGDKALMELAMKASSRAEA